MKKRKSICTSAILLFILFCMSSCYTSDRLYSWHNYEDITYRYNKTHAEELKASVLEEYQTIIEYQRGIRGKVPPGMYAEYGYMLYRTGKQEEGLNFLKEEIKLYPESEKYISRIIKQLEKNENNENSTEQNPTEQNSGEQKSQGHNSEN